MSIHTQLTTAMMHNGSPVIVFGKVPAFGDFLRSNAVAQEVLWFDSWLQQGLEAGKAALAGSWDETYGRSGGMNFVTFPENSDALMIGTLIPSSDKGGRSYPLWCATLVGRTVLGEQLLGFAPAAMKDFINEARQFVRSAVGRSDYQEVLNEARELALPAPDSLSANIRLYNDFLGTTTLEAFLCRSLGSFDAPAKYMVFHNLKSVLGPMWHRDLSKWSLGLRFPVDEGEHQAFDAVFWLQLSLKLLGNPATTPFIFWGLSGNRGKGYLFVFFRKPSPKTFVQMLQPERTSDTVCEVELSPEGGGNGHRNDIGPSLVAMLDDSGILLDEFLLRI